MTDKHHPTLPISAEDVHAAATRIAGQVEFTQLKKSQTLSVITGCELWLKFEIFQFTAAYKERGALNTLLSLDTDSINGVIAMSAGNHAQGLSYHARRLGLPATIVMPVGTPFNKIKRTEELGATVLLRGSNIEEATAAAKHLAEEQRLAFVHPFDDPLIMAGQGTVALEMLAQNPELDTLVISVGGGGLISGMATAAKAINPDIRIIGVQTEAWPSMKEFIIGEDLHGSKLTIAEGIAVGEPGLNTRAVVKELVDDILIVKESQIEAALVLMMEIEKVVVEGAGAIGLAAIQANPSIFAGRKVGMVLTGGNIDSRLLANAITRGMNRDGRLSRMLIDLKDQPGSLAELTRVIAEAGANVIDLKHQREFGSLNLKMTQVEMVAETKDQAHADDLVTALRAAGFTVTPDEVG